MGNGLMMIGIFYMRYDIVIPGQMESVYHSLGVVEATDLLSYTPTLHEIMASLFGIGFIASGLLCRRKNAQRPSTRKT